MVKIYELTRFDGMSIRLNWCGQNITVEFKGGDTRHRAKFLTTNLFIQDALENDQRFGKLFILKPKYEDTPEAKEEAAVKPKRKVTKVRDINGALRWLADQGFNPTGDSDLDDLMDKANVEFPNLKR